MKKSRILVPALAMIAFSTAASVAGSVAWFTANRTASVNAGTYAVVKTTANLEVEVNEGLATTVTDNVVSLGDNKLTDGSFNHKTGNIYQPNADGTDLDSTNPEVAYNDSQIATKLERGTLPSPSTGKVYTAATFELVFTIKYGSSAGNYGLFLDNTAGKTAFSVSGGAAALTAKGFRMGFYPSGTGENGRATVLADLQDNGTWDHDGDGAEASPTAEVNKIKYVASTSNFAGTDYAAADYDLIDSAYNTALPSTAPTKAQAGARPDYLGYFAFAANSDVTLTLTVVCWFDGNDPEIRNRANETDYQSVAAQLNFEAIKLAD